MYMSIYLSFIGKDAGMLSYMPKLTNIADTD